MPTPDYLLLGDGSLQQPFRLCFRKCALATVLLPFFAFLCCVIISVTVHNDESTATHCLVTNLLPSISAAIGGFQPQGYIWRICIALHSTPRLLVGAMYHHHYSHLLGKNDAFRNIITATTILYVVENAALIGISYISSSENKGVHETCFILFTLSSLLYMIFSIGLSSSLANHSNLYVLTFCLLTAIVDEHFVYRNLIFFMCRLCIMATLRVTYWKLDQSRKAKVVLFLVNITSLITALYSYYRHNKYCEPYVYTFFALFEYVFVLTNMAFHMTAYLDFYAYEFSIGPAFSQKLRLI